MLPSLGFKGTAEVVNKGVDVSLITDAKGKEKLFQLSRYLVVCGISAAVIAVCETDPVDMKTIRYFEDTTPLLLFFDQIVADHVIPQLLPETIYYRVEDCTTRQLLQDLPDMIRKAKQEQEEFRDESDRNH